MNLVDAILAVAKYTVPILTAYLSLIIAYRILLHPLAKYPGPFLAKFTDGYAGWHALATRLHLTTYEDHKKYGPVMRHGPNRLIFNSARALHDIYRNPRVTKSHVYALTIQANGIDSIFNAVDRNRHATKRRLIGRSVTERAMRNFEPTMQEQIDVFLASIWKDSSRSPTPIDMTQLCKRLGLDIVGHLAFGFALNTQTDDKYRFILDGLAMGNYRSNSFMQLPLLKNPFLDTLLHLLSRSRRESYIRALQHMINTRMSMGKHAKEDLYSSVADDIDNDAAEGGRSSPDSIMLSELWSEAVFFFPAGGDTASTCLAALFFYLAHDPDAYRNLSREIRQTFAKGADIRGGPQLSGCRYLRACIDEALRMSSPVSGTLWRELAKEEEANGPLIVDGHVIPKGVQVGVNVYTIHHNEEFFPDPFVFRPDRWLENDGSSNEEEEEEKLRKMNSAFAAFSTGARGCAGKAMAYLETSLVVAQTLWYFDFGVVAQGKEGKGGKGAGSSGAKGEYPLRDVFTAIHEGPHLVFRPRVEECRDFDG